MADKNGITTIALGAGALVLGVYAWDRATGGNFEASVTGFLTGVSTLLQKASAGISGTGPSATSGGTSTSTATGSQTNTPVGTQPSAATSAAGVGSLGQFAPPYNDKGL